MNNKKNIILSVIALFVIVGAVYFFSEKDGRMVAYENDPDSLVSEAEKSNVKIRENRLQTVKNFSHMVTIETNLGEIIFETYDNDAPKTVENFITLSNKGFYTNVIFHRIIPKFMIQGGDPTGTGRGGPGYAFADELNPETDSYKNGYKKGVVAMANAGPDTNGSQFFIMLEEYPLPNSYTIFGKVVKGQDVVDAIGKVKTDENDKPLTDVIIKKVTVKEKDPS